MRNEQEKLARQWAERIKSVPEVNYGPEANAAAEYILATTTPPTMADVEWDVDEMPGTGALTKHGRLWIMRDDAGDAIECISPDLEEIAFVAKKGLTPNGKKYELREITEPEHPETLCTVEDYENAPEGAIVAIPNVADVWVKAGGKWKQGEYNHRSSDYLADTERILLREGWDE